MSRQEYGRRSEHRSGPCGSSPWPWRLSRRPPSRARAPLSRRTSLRASRSMPPSSPAGRRRARPKPSTSGRASRRRQVPPPERRRRAGAPRARSATDIAKKIQNPIGDVYSFPFQSNTNFGYGSHHGTQEVLNIQPVIPIHINDDWNIISRTILPLVWTPDLAPVPSVPFGTGPSARRFFFRRTSPSTIGSGVLARSSRSLQSAART